MKLVAFSRSPTPPFLFHPLGGCTMLGRSGNRLQDLELLLAFMIFQLMTILEEAL
jgi:hypothetical protein